MLPPLCISDCLLKRPECALFSECYWYTEELLRLDSRQGVQPIVAYSHTVSLLKLEAWCALLCQFHDRKLLWSAQCNLPFAGAQSEVISRYLQGEIDTQRIAVPVGKLPQMHTSPPLGVIQKP